MKVHSLLLLFLMIATTLRSQNLAMEEFMYSSGKIHVVLAVILIIFILLFLYLFRLDRRIRKMEE